MRCPFDAVADRYDTTFTHTQLGRWLREAVWEHLAAAFRPGDRVLELRVVVMGPLCPWEVGWHLGHGEVHTAFRRWRSGVEARVGNGATVHVWYPSPWRLRREFASHFRHLKTVGIGVLLPPSYLSHLVERWPRLFETLAALDRRLGRWFPWAWLGDHYLVVFERIADANLALTPLPAHLTVGTPPPSPKFGRGGRGQRRRVRTSTPAPRPPRPSAPSLKFACPACRTPLEAAGPEALRCPADGAVYRRVDGIWRFLLPEREAFFQQFMREYETVRRAEGRGSDDPAYYRALPFEDRTGRFRDDWRIRAKSFQTLVERVLVPLEAERERPLVILDLGAGNGWLSYRLAQRGHAVAAVDLLTNAFDGLGAHVHYDAAFTPVQAEFDRLPFTDGGADLVVFNASLHYSTDYERTLGEALRVLRSDGRLVIMDSPVYRDARSGEQMVREREAQFEAKYGFPSDALPSENYLTYDRLEELAEALGLRWELIRPFYGWRWALRPWKARLLGRREPAQFLVIVGRRR